MSTYPPTSFFRDVPDPVVSLTGSTDTREFDHFRQGVELTQDKHWAQGIYKISSGEQNHVFFAPGKLNTRISRLDENKFLDESTNPDPATRIGAASTSTTPSTPDEGSHSVQGTIDVFDKRRAAERQIVSERGIRANMSNSSFGDEKERTSSETITDVVEQETSDRNCVFYDQQEYVVVNEIRRNKIQRFSVASAMFDTRIKTQAHSDSRSESNLFSYVTGSANYDSDSRLPLNKKSATVGFVYNSCRANTDSVAFGGLLES